MRILVDGRDELTPEQGEVIVRGYESTQETVPFVEGLPDSRAWVLDSESKPIGSLSMSLFSENVAEIGLRFWEFNPRIGLIAANWIDEVLDEYPVVMARCFPDNWKVKRLLQRGGFRLMKIVDGVEFHVTSRDTFLGARKEPRNG